MTQVKPQAPPVTPVAGNVDLSLGSPKVESVAFTNESDDEQSRADFKEGVNEIKLQIEEGVLDVGQCASEYEFDDYCRYDQQQKYKGYICEKCVETDGGHCFYDTCCAAGVEVDVDTRSVIQLPNHQLMALASKAEYKVFLTVFGKNSKCNHIDLVKADCSNANSALEVVTGGGSRVTVVITTMQHFFNKSNQWAFTKFYADDGDTARLDGGFGRDAPVLQKLSQPRVSMPARNDTGYALPQSVVAESVVGGGSNVSGGVTRSRRRNFNATKISIPTTVAKSYRVSAATKFNNFDELYQDTISREHAQDIIEDLFETWGLPTEQSDAAKYAEDLLFAFLIATTASNKADYNFVYPIPVKPVERHGETVTEIMADFTVFSNILASRHGVTRRQFARGVADDQRAYLKAEDNTHLLPSLANRVGCELGLAYLAFDGATHCTGMTTREQTFTRTLESRNLFERDDILAQGASDRLMQGMSGGVRSVAPR